MAVETTHPGDTGEASPPSGPPTAAMLAAGIGALTLGILTTLAEGVTSI